MIILHFDNLLVLCHVSHTVNLGYLYRNMWTTSRGDPEYSGQKKPKRIFPFEFQLKFAESLAKWKVHHVSIELQKHERKFRRTRDAVGTRAVGGCFHSFFEFSQTFTNVPITR